MLSFQRLSPWCLKAAAKATSAHTCGYLQIKMNVRHTEEEKGEKGTTCKFLACLGKIFVRYLNKSGFFACIQWRALRQTSSKQIIFTSSESRFWALSYRQGNIKTHSSGGNMTCHTFEDVNILLECQVVSKIVDPLPLTPLTRVIQYLWNRLSCELHRKKAIMA